MAWSPPVPVATLWATLGSGKKKGPVTIDGEINNDRTSCVVRINLQDIDSPSLSVNHKEVLWMYTAHFCFCCGRRDRELFCPRDSPEQGSEHYSETYGTLKSFEAGQDVRKMSRLELMYHDGDVLSLGLRCESEEDTQYFRMLSGAFEGSAELTSCRSSSCQAHGQRRSSSSVDVPVSDGAAELKANRHMEELLAAEESAKAAVSQKAALRRKRKNRGNAAAVPEGPQQQRSSNQQRDCQPPAVSAGQQDALPANDQPSSCPTASMSHKETNVSRDAPIDSQAISTSEVAVEAQVTPRATSVPSPVQELIYPDKLNDSQVFTIVQRKTGSRASATGDGALQSGQQQPMVSKGHLRGNPFAASLTKQHMKMAGQREDARSPLTGDSNSLQKVLQEMEVGTPVALPWSPRHKILPESEEVRSQLCEELLSMQLIETSKAEGDECKKAQSLVPVVPTPHPLRALTRPREAQLHQAATYKAHSQGVNFAKTSNDTSMSSSCKASCVCGEPSSGMSRIQACLQDGSVGSAATANMQETSLQSHTLPLFPLELLPLPPLEETRRVGVQTRSIGIQQEDDEGLVALRQELDEAKAMLSTSLANQAEQLKIISGLQDQFGMLQTSSRSYVFDRGYFPREFGRLPSSGAYDHLEAGAPTCSLASMQTCSERSRSWSWPSGSSSFEESAVGLHSMTQLPIHTPPPGLGIQFAAWYRGEPAKVHVACQGAALTGCDSISSTTSEPMFVTTALTAIGFPLVDCSIGNDCNYASSRHESFDDGDDASTWSTVCCLVGECGVNAKAECEVCKDMLPAFLDDSDDDASRT